MWNDPIVEEVHRIRKQLLARAKGNLRKAIDGAAQRQKGGGRVVLKASPRPPAGSPPRAPKGRIQV
jgi:hypothetical protein